MFKVFHSPIHLLPTYSSLHLASFTLPLSLLLLFPFFLYIHSPRFLIQHSYSFILPSSFFTSLTFLLSLLSFTLTSFSPFLHSSSFFLHSFFFLLAMIFKLTLSLLVPGFSSFVFHSFFLILHSSLFLLVSSFFVLRFLFSIFNLTPFNLPSFAFRFHSYSLLHHSSSYSNFAPTSCSLSLLSLLFIFTLTPSYFILPSYSSIYIFKPHLSLLRLSSSLIIPPTSFISIHISSNQCFFALSSTFLLSFIHFSNSFFIL